MKTTATTTKSTASYTIIDTHTIGSKPAKQAALDFGAILGADKGYSSRIVRINNRTYDCVASDNRAVRFQNPQLACVK